MQGLHVQLSPAPGTALQSPETGGQNRRYRDLSLQQRPHARYLNRGNARKLRAICQRPGNIGSHRTAWWAREDSKLQPDHYEWSARLLAACFSILMDEPECGALVGPGERNALEQEPDGQLPSSAAFAISAALRAGTARRSMAASAWQRFVSHPPESAPAEACLKREPCLRCYEFWFGSAMTHCRRRPGTSRTGAGTAGQRYCDTLRP